MNGQFCTASVCQWVLGGLLVSLVLGAVAAPVRYGLRKLAGTWEPQSCKRHIYDFLIGFIERGAITVIATYDLKAGAAFATTWIGLKLASGWHRSRKDLTNEEVDILAVGATTGMVGSLISALFALAGALIICGQWP